MKQTRLTDKSPIEFDSRNLTDDKISRIKSELMRVDWNGTLNNDDCSVNFENFCTKLNMIMDNIAPIKHIRISGKRRFVEPWMSTSLEIVQTSFYWFFLPCRDLLPVSLFCIWFPGFLVPRCALLFGEYL